MTIYRQYTMRKGRRYSSWQETAAHRDLLKTLGQELRTFYEPPRDIPHRILTLLMKLNDRGRTRSRPRIKMLRQQD